MRIKTIMAFIGGFMTGCAIGVFGAKKYFEERYQKRYEEDRAALEGYYRRTDEYARRDELVGENETNPTESDSIPNGRMTQNERNRIKEKLNEKHGIGNTNYAGMYKNVDHRDNSMYDLEATAAEAEHPLDQGEDGEIGTEDLRICANCKFYEEESNLCRLSYSDTDAGSTCSCFENFHETSTEEDAFDEHQKNKNRPPKIISVEAYGDLPAYIDHEVLYFYSYDEMLCDDNEEPVEEPERLIGDALTKYGFIDNDEEIIFVMNYALDTSYEIQKVYASWTDSH